VTQEFDVTPQSSGIDARNLAAVPVTLVPVALTQLAETGAPNLQSHPLRITRVELLVRND
jgi:hypothetical protein